MGQLIESINKSFIKSHCLEVSKSPNQWDCSADLKKGLTSFKSFSMNEFYSFDKDSKSNIFDKIIFKFKSYYKPSSNENNGQNISKHTAEIPPSTVISTQNIQNATENNPSVTQNNLNSTHTTKLNDHHFDFIKIRF
jgi:hypothetical protein